MREHSLAVQSNRLHLGARLQPINIDGTILMNARNVLIAAGKVQKRNTVAHNVRIEANGLLEHFQIEQLNVARGQTDGKIGAFANFRTGGALNVLDFQLTQRNDFVCRKRGASVRLWRE
jgi:hypothetical protein